MSPTTPRATTPITRARRSNSARFFREELESLRGATVPDLIGSEVRLLFVGINPGLFTVLGQRAKELAFVQLVVDFRLVSQSAQRRSDWAVPRPFDT